MPSLSTRSMTILRTCHPMLQKVLKEAINSTDFAVVSGKRGAAEQDELYRTGKSQRVWPESAHNDPDDEYGNVGNSSAVDVGLWKSSRGRIDWKDTEAWLVMQGHIERVAYEMDVGLLFGSNWDNDEDFDDENFRDYGHIRFLWHDPPDEVPF